MAVTCGLDCMTLAVSVLTGMLGRCREVIGQPLSRSLKCRLLLVWVPLSVVSVPRRPPLVMAGFWLAQLGEQPLHATTRRRDCLHIVANSSHSLITGRYYESDRGGRVVLQAELAVIPWLH